ncbi:MAG: hypothetical protein JWO52_5186 [Gammaproteobacteria bacterium]|jgi:hypothetical protein|nr:hypothetical protein [Gammaproteobacteria bacterium]
MKKPSQSGCSVRAAASGDTGGELAEVTVTAERRTENLQDVPIAIQAGRAGVDTHGLVRAAA